MKKSFKTFCQGIASIKYMSLAVAILISNAVYAQEKQSITGKLIEEKSNQVVPFATVALIKTSDSKIAGGSMSDENGIFSISPVIQGSYILKVSNIGFKPVTRNIEVISNGITDVGILLLQDTSIMLKELVIVGERIKAKTESDRITFNVTKKMLDVSDTGTDLLKLIPGVQIDLMQNISLEGSRDILIYVDGKERDKSFISQLSPEQIDRIELISAPPSNYDGNATGAINIVLKKDKVSGISGHLLAEIPVSSSLVYAFPSYSLNWGLKKCNLYTSYNGELTYLDLQEKTSRRVWKENDTNEINISQNLRQKESVNRFHFGVDYFVSDRDQFNFYGYINPSSRRLEGTVYSQITSAISDSATSVKEDYDKSNSTFYSLFYKRSFEKKGRELTADISNYLLWAVNSTNYYSTRADNDFNSREFAAKPKQNSFILRLDYKTPILNKLIFSSGFKARLQLSQDRSNNFEYSDNIYAVYGNLAYKQEKTDMSFGLRAEKSVAELKDAFINPCITFLPSATLRFKLTSKQNIQFSFNRTIKRPGIYQLNPYTSMSDPYMISKGNPFLKPELTGSIHLEHSLQFNGNYIASRLFFNRTTNSINNLMLINETNYFETQVENLGTINQLGLQFSGTLKAGFATLNPYVKMFSLQTSGNSIADYYFIRNRNSIGLESGLSAIASFKHDFACSFTLQYNSARYDIQGSSYSDALYFLSVEKAFKKVIKLGIVSAMPLKRSFTYNGSKVEAVNFRSIYEGNVALPSVPVWFKLGFQFNPGKNNTKISREKEEFDNVQKKGF
jgi:hypothetical protein